MFAQHQGVSCFSHCPTSKKAGGTQEVGRGHSWPQMTPNHRTSCSAIKLGWGGRLAGAAVAWGMAGLRSVGDEKFLYIAPLVLLHFSVCFLSLSLLVFFLHFFLLLNCLYLNPQIFSLLPFSPHSTVGAVSKCGAWLPTRVKPWQ